MRFEGPSDPHHEGEEDEEKIRERISTTQNFYELIKVFETVEGLWGSQGWYADKALKARVIEVMALSQIWSPNRFIGALEEKTKFITNTAGLREKVEELALRILEKRKIEEQDEEHEENE